MAKQGKFVSGSIGRVVFYELNGESIMRSKPARVKQSKATRTRAGDFGRLTRYSRLIREYWVHLGEFKQRELMLRLNSALLRWNKDSKGDQQLMSRNIRDLESLELNTESLLIRNCKLSPGMDISQPGKVLISIPAFKPADDIIAPPGTCKIRFTWVLVRCNTFPKSENKPGQDDHRMEQTWINMDDSLVPEQQIEMQIGTLPGDIILLALRLTYFTGSKKHPVEVREKNWMPAGVVGAGYRKRR